MLLVEVPVWVFLAFSNSSINRQWARGSIDTRGIRSQRYMVSKLEVCVCFKRDERNFKKMLSENKHYTVQAKN